MHFQGEAAWLSISIDGLKANEHYQGHQSHLELELSLLPKKSLRLTNLEITSSYLHLNWDLSFLLVIMNGGGSEFQCSHLVSRSVF
jgi:hypothetical protein